MQYDISGLGNVNRILLYPPEKPLSISFQPVAEYVSFLRNVTFVQQFKGMRSFDVKMRFDNRNDFYDLLNFFKTCKGNLLKFWFPSWIKEYKVVADIINTDRVKIFPCDFSNRYDGYLRVFLMTSNRFIVRKVIDFSTYSQYEELVLNDQISGTIYANEVLMMGRVHLVRFQNPEIEFKIYFASFDKFFLEANFNLIELPNEYAEIET